MPALRKYLKGFITNTTGLQLFQLLRFGTFFLTGILLSKRLSVASIGFYETLMFVSTVASYFWVTGMINSLLSLYPVRSGNSKSLLFNVFLVLCLFSLLFFGFMQAFSSAIAGYFHITDLVTFRIFLVYFLLNNPAFLIEYIFLLKNKPKFILLYGIFVFFLHLLAVVVPVYLGYPVQVSLNLLVITALLKFLFLLALVTRSSDTGIDRPFIREYLWIAAPLVFAALVAGAAEFSDSLIISHLFDKSSFAIFRYGARELPLTLFLANAFSNAMVPLIAGGENLPSRLDEIRAKSARLMHLLFPVSILLMVLSPWLYTYFFTAEFRPSSLIFNTYLLLIINRLVFPQALLLGYRKTRSILLISVLELLLNIIFSVFLALRLGIAGVALGTFIAFFCEKVLLLIAVNRELKISPSRYVPVKTLFMYSLLLLAAYFGFLYYFNK